MTVLKTQVIEKDGCKYTLRFEEYKLRNDPTTTYISVKCVKITNTNPGGLSKASTDYHGFGICTFSYTDEPLLWIDSDYALWDDGTMPDGYQDQLLDEEKPEIMLEYFYNHTVGQTRVPGCSYKGMGKVMLCMLLEYMQDNNWHGMSDPNTEIGIEAVPDDSGGLSNKQKEKVREKQAGMYATMYGARVIVPDGLKYYADVRHTPMLTTAGRLHEACTKKILWFEEDEQLTSAMFPDVPYNPVDDEYLEIINSYTKDIDDDLEIIPPRQADEAEESEDMIPLRFYEFYEEDWYKFRTEYQLDNVHTFNGSFDELMDTMDLSFTSEIIDGIYRYSHPTEGDFVVKIVQNDEGKRLEYTAMVLVYLHGMFGVGPYIHEAAVMQDDTVVLVMEAYDMDLRGKRKLDEHWCNEIRRQYFVARSAGLTHRDLTRKNILINLSGRRGVISAACLTDFDDIMIDTPDESDNREIDKFLRSVCTPQ